MTSILVITHPINGLIMILMPVILGAFLARRFKFGWRLWWIGSLTFIFSQVGHIPFNAAVGLLFERGFISPPRPENQLAFNAIFLGFSAGIWEEGFRYAAYRWWAKDARSWPKGLMLGTGHGGIEAIIIGVLVLLNFGILAVMGSTDLSSILSESQQSILAHQTTAYWSMAWYDSLLGALERSFTLPIQIALSIIVLQVFLKSHIRWLFLAIGWHAVVDSVVVYLAPTAGIYTTEIALGVMSLISIAVIFYFRQSEPTQVQIEVDKSVQPNQYIRPDVDSIEATAEKLEESRFN